MELIQYVDAQGRPTGETAEKLSAHHASTRRHLAFSAYIFDPNGRFLLTRRADTKKVWPGVWTNSCCGHPAPGESLEAAVRRRCEYELGLTELTGLHCALPNFTYTTPLYHGIMENEFCPVFIARTTQQPNPNADEVSHIRWVNWVDLPGMIARDPRFL
jgi:isopentenyl-diphosphate delta-isomerase